MSVNWKAVDTALQQSRHGNHLGAISALSALLPEADSNADRAAILLTESSCYSQAGNILKSRELLESARMCAREDRVLLSQVEMSEGSLHAQNKEYDFACEKFAAVKSEYRDLVCLPEHNHFAVELDSRLACALYEAGRYLEAVDLFEGLFQRENLEEKQRLQLWYGFALIRAGRYSEAQAPLFEASTGSDPGLAQTASDYLSGIGKPSRKL